MAAEQQRHANICTAARPLPTLRLNVYSLLWQRARRRAAQLRWTAGAKRDY